MEERRTGWHPFWGHLQRAMGEEWSGGYSDRSSSNSNSSNGNQQAPRKASRGVLPPNLALAKVEE